MQYSCPQGYQPPEASRCRNRPSVAARLPAGSHRLGLRFLPRSPPARIRARRSRAAFQLRAAGLIDYRNGKMRIRDVDGLKKVSCECFLIIQKEAMQVFRVGTG